MTGEVSLRYSTSRAASAAICSQVDRRSSGLQVYVDLALGVETNVVEFVGVIVVGAELAALARARART